MIRLLLLVRYSQTAYLGLPSFLTKSLVLRSFVLFISLSCYISVLATDDRALLSGDVDAGEDVTTCRGTAVQLEATGTGNFIWTPATDLSCTSCPNPVATPSVTTEYVVTCDDGAGNVSTDTVIVSILPTATINTIDTTEPTACDADDGQIIIDATDGGVAIEYSITNGFEWQASNTFSSLDGGIYNIKVRNANDNSCEVDFGEVSLPVPLAPTVDDVTIVDPNNCGTLTGTISVEASGGINFYNYSHDNGGTWQAGNTFTNLTAGFYPLKVRNSNATCEVAGGTFLLADPELPVIEEVIQVMPACGGGNDGTITIVTAEYPGTLLYTIDDGATWIQDSTFTGLSAGEYNIAVRLESPAAACITNFDSNPVVFGGTDGPPSLDGAAPVNSNNCDSPNGSITIFASGGSNSYEFSINDGQTWQSSSLFTGLEGGTYQPAVRNSDGSCEVMGNPIVITQPARPVIESVTSTDVTECGMTDGTITIIVSGGEGAPYSYSLNDGVPQSSNVFSDLPSGEYVIEVSNGDGTCTVSGGTEMIDQPTTPTINNISKTDPLSCGASDGTITIEVAGNIGDFEYSIDDGSTFVATNVFNTLMAGTYTVKVRNAVDDSCETDGEIVMLNSPAMPTIDDIVVTQPTNCENPNGVIVITSNNDTGNFMYSIDGGTVYQASNTFNNLGDGVYTIAVQDGTCETINSTTTTLDPAELPVINGVSVTQPSGCGASNTGSITIFASGDDLEYTVNGGTDWQSASFFGMLPAGTYDIRVRKTTGLCEVSAPMEVLTAATSPTISDVSFTDPSDCNLDDGIITITATGDSDLEYSVTGGSSWQSSNMFSSLSGISYDVRVRYEGGDCEEIWPDGITLTEPTPPTIESVNSSNINGCSATGGMITITASGGSGSYEYSITGGTTWQASGVFNNLAPDTYNIAIRNDSPSCEVFGGTSIISATNPPVINEIVLSNPTGCGLSDGVITVAASGDNALEHSIDGGMTWQLSNNFPELSEGAYDIRVRYTNETCMISGGNQTLSAAAAPDITQIIMDNPDCSGVNGQIEIIVDYEGTSPLEYSINGGTDWQSSNIFMDLVANTYPIRVRVSGEGGCMTSGGASILEEHDAPMITFVDFISPSSCETVDGLIQIIVSGNNTGGFEFSIDGGNTWNPSNTFNGLGSGDYVPAVRPVNTPCIIIGDGVELEQPEGPMIDDIAVVHPDCDMSDGSITVTASGGSGDYQYTINNGTDWQNSNFFNNLGEGNYQIGLRNADQTCETIAAGLTALIEPDRPLVNMVNSTNPTCEMNNGSIQVNASGGTGNLEYSINGGVDWQSANVFNDLGIGTYEVLVRNDEPSCATPAATIQLTEPAAPQMSEINVTQPTNCGLSDGSIQVVASGVGTLEYSINDGMDWQLSPTFNGLSQGTYIVKIRFEDGTCETLGGTIVLAEPEAPVIDIVDVVEPSDCDLSDAVITITTIEDESNYEFSVNGGMTWQNSNVFSGLGAGEYQIAVRNDDSAGSCVVLGEVIIIKAQEMPTIVSVDFEDPDCEMNNGSITINAMSSGDLEYSINNGGDWSTNPVFTDLGEDIYQILVRNINGTCEVSGGSMSLNEPAAPNVVNFDSTNPDCNGDNGSIVITANGGLIPLEYSIDGGMTYQESNEFMGLSPGTYDIFVRNTDDSCPVYGGTTELIIPNPPEVTQITTTTSTQCNDSNPDGTITISTNDTNVEYSIDGGETWQVALTFTDLSGGTYNVLARIIGEECSVSVGVATIDEPTSPAFSMINRTNPSDCDTADGSIEIIPEGNATLMYSIDGGNTYQASNTFDNLEAGEYNVFIRNDDATCATDIGTVILTAPAQPEIDEVNVGNSICIENSGTIQIVASGGVGNLEYSNDGGATWQSSNLFLNLAPGTYTPAVRNNDESCQVIENEITIIEIGGPEITGVTFTQPSDCGVSDGSITITATTEDGTLEYTINGGETWEASGFYDNLSGGVYEILVRNDPEASCEAEAENVILIGGEEPTINEIVTVDPSECGIDDGIIQVLASGTNGLEYSIDNGDTWQDTNTFSDLSGGTYEVLVRNDDESCEVSSGDIVVVAPVMPTITSINVTDIEDCAANDGEIEIIAAGGSNIEYSINGGLSFQTNNTFENLSAGDYNIIIQNVGGSCMVDGGEVTIDGVPQPIITEIVMEEPTSCMINDGRILVFINLDRNDFEFSIDGGMNFQDSHIFDGLSAGNYEIRIRYRDNSCEVEAVADVVLEGETIMITAVNTSDPTTCGADNGFLDISLSAQGLYEYSIDDGLNWQSMNFFDGLSAGNYTVRVRNVDGSCEAETEMVTLSDPNFPTITAINDGNPSSCAIADGTIEIIATGDNTLQYSIDGGGTYQTENTFNNLDEGVYNIQVSYTDGGCMVASDFEITLAANDQVSVTNISSTDPSSCDIEDGTITITATGNAGIEYSIDGGMTYQTDNVFEGLSGGTYTLFVSYADGACAQNSGTTTLSEPAAPTIDNVNSNDPSGCGQSDGSIEITATGANTLEYSINGGTDWQSASTFNDLAEGTYNIQVRYIGGTCLVSSDAALILTAPDDLMISTVETTDAGDCVQNNGTITISLSTGGDNVEYSIDGGTSYQASNTFTGLANGNYTVRVRVAGSDCEATYENNPAVVSGGNGVLISNVISETPTDCGILNGQITITADCEIPDSDCELEYSIDGGASYQATNVFDGLNGGNYNVRVRKTDGTCEMIWGDVAVISLTPPVIESVTHEHPTDCDDLDGTITVVATGESTLEYSIDNGENWQTSNVFTDLGEGVYTIQARLENSSCIVTHEEMIVLESCCLIRFVLEQLDDGRYQVSMIPDTTLTEPDNATMGLQVTLLVPADGFELDNFMSANPMIGFEVNTINEPAQNPNTDYINVTLATTTMVLPYVQGQSVPLFTFENIDLCANHGETINIMQNQTDPFQSETVGNMISILGIADEDITICTFGTGTAPVYSALQDVTVVQPSECGGDDGSLTIVTDCSIDACSYEYSIDGGISFGDENIFTSLTAGEYHVVIRDLNESCDIEFGDNPILIGTGDEPIITAVNTVDPTTCTGTNGSIQIIATGNNLEYSIDGGTTYQSSNTFQNLGADTYNVMVRADGNCAIPYLLNPVIINEGVDGQPQLSDISATNNSTCGAADGRIVITASGMGTLEYSIDGGMTWQSSNVFENLTEGAYNIAVRNAEDGTCEISYVENPVVLMPLDGSGETEITDVAMTHPSCSNDDGMIVVTAQSCSDIEYSLDGENWQTANVFDDLMGGVYTVTVRDVNDNSLTDSQSAIILTTQTVCPDTIMITIPNEATAVCLDAVLDVPNGPGAVSVCEEGEQVELVLVQEESCLTIVPDENFVGIDMVCIVTCDVVDATLCDTTIIFISVEEIEDLNINPDTTLVTIPDNTTSTECITQFIDVPNGVGGVSICDDPENINTGISIINDEVCASLQPINGFIGTDTVCVVVCDLFIPGLCDTTIIIVTVEPGDLVELPDTLYNVTFVNTPIEICLDEYLLPADDVVLTSCGDPLNGTLSLDGECLTYNPAFNFIGIDEMCVMVCDANDATNCQEVTVIIIVDPGFIVPLPDTIMDVTMINTPIEICLEEYLLPAEDVVLTSCGDPMEGALTFDGTCLTYDPNFNFLGVDEMCVMVCDANDATNCQEVTVIITVEPGDIVPLPDTIMDVTMINTPIEICLEEYLLPAEDVVLTSCGDPMEGALTFDGTCLTYDPNFNFLGVDEMCVMVCDANDATNCQEVTVIITVEPGDMIALPDTIREQTLINTPIMVCMEDYILPWENVVMASCGEPTDGMMSIDGTCLTYDPDFNFLGMDTMCIMVCDAANTGDCQEVTVIITVDPGDGGVPLPDTIMDVTMINMPIEICLEEYLLPAEDVVLTSCGEPTDGILTFDGTCLTYDPNFNFLGIDTMCVSVCDANDATNCQEVTVIITVEPGDIVSLPDTLYNETEIETPLEICLDELYMFPAENIELTSCGNPMDGTLTFDGTCVTYTPDMDFLGLDTMCVSICDVTDPTNCDTTLLIINVTPVTDTITIIIDNDEPIDTCLTEDIIQVLGDTLNTTICEVNEDILTVTLVDSLCVNIDPVDGFMGTETICLVTCDENDPPICDTTIIVIMTEEEDCMEEIFVENELSFEATETEICVPIALAESANYNINLDGDPYTLPIEPCESDTFVTYFYDIVPGDLGAGPYNVETWIINDTAYAGLINDAAGLENFMNFWDSDGNWVIDPVTLSISGGDGMSDYDSLVIRQEGTGEIMTLFPMVTELPGGFTMTITGEGTHIVNIENATTGCSDEITIILDDGVFNEDTIHITTDFETPTDPICVDTTGLVGNVISQTICDDPTNGMVDSTAINCFVYTPDDNFVGLDTFCVVLCDDSVPMMCDTTIVIVEVLPDDCGIFEMDEMTIILEDCDSLAQLCLDVNLAEFANYDVLDNGEMYTGGLSGCEFDTTFRYLYFTIPDAGNAGPYTLDTWVVNGTTFSGAFLDIPALADSMNVWDPTGNWVLNEGAFVLVGGNPANTYGMMTISQDNTGANAVLMPNIEPVPVGTALSLTAGVHQLTLTNTITGCTDMAMVTVTCPMDTMGVFADTTINIITHVGQPETICLDEVLGINAGDITSITNICEDQGTGNVIFTLDTLTSCVLIESLMIGVDTACFEVCIADTCAVVTINVTIEDVCEDFIPMDVVGTGVDCETQDTILCIPVPLGEIMEYSIETDGMPYEGDLISCNLDSIFNYSYFSLLALGDGPFNVDSWTVNGNVFMGEFMTVADLVDSLNVWDPSANWTFDESILVIQGANPSNEYGPIMITNIASGGSTALPANFRLIPLGTGLQVGLGTHEIVFTHMETGCRDTIMGTVACMTTETIFDTISVADIEQICLDTFELQGNFVSISNACPDESGEAVVFNIDADSLCVTYEGFEPGTETACIILCDDLGVCDTTYIIVTILEMDNDLDAVDDLGTTIQGGTVVIDVFTNDVIPNNTLDTFYIVNAPTIGTAEFDIDGLVTYVHNGEECDVVDNFTYVICNTFTCDTALVTIDIPCDTIPTDGEFMIYPGFSPNGDQINDTFVITGLGDFPNNRLQIFNRWGNLVHDVGGYRNDWAGTWKGNDLPSGTYFYLLDLGNGKKPMSGYLVIRR